MSRPLIVSDCDEVLLYMVSHFRDWLGEEQGVHFEMGGNNFARAMRHRDSGEAVGEQEIWRLLNLFFDGQMHRQTPVEGAVTAISELTKHADVVVLTNLKDFRQEARARQLADLGIALKVYTNQGPKGPAFRAILDEYQPSRAIFIDDLAQHHDSVSDVAPDVGRLHLCAEPSIASNIDCAHKAGHADARIDDWATALPWLIDKLYSEAED
ncbi:MAG: HAD family hydrolase [Novosphingobium sp.]|nr:HAD family hydrolase [Novosphingobium sp.]